MSGFSRWTLCAGAVAALGFGSAAMADQARNYDLVLQDAQAYAPIKLAEKGPGAPPYGYAIAQGGSSLIVAPGLQFRYAANYGDGRKNGNSDIEDGFEITRARLVLMGNVEKIQFYVQWAAGDIDGGVALLDAIVGYPLDPQLILRAGQIKAAFAHETAVSPFDLLGATRSLVNGLIGIPDGENGRTQGAGLWYGDDANPIHAIVLFHDGAGSSNSNFQNNGVNWAMGAAVAYTVFGNYNDWWTFSARDTQKDMLVLSAGGDFTQGDNFNLGLFMLEAQYETASRLAIYAAFNGMVLDMRNVPVDDSFNWGAHIQAGYACAEQCEVFGRFSYVKYENETAVGEDTFYEITAGVNYYPVPKLGNNVKVTAEVTWLPNGSPVALPHYEIVGGTSEDEVVGRLQFQLRP